jgi:hypothetical protein
MTQEERLPAMTKIVFIRLSLNVYFAGEPGKENKKRGYLL